MEEIMIVEKRFTNKTIKSILRSLKSYDDIRVRSGRKIVYDNSVESALLDTSPILKTRATRVILNYRTIQVEI